MISTKIADYYTEKILTYGPTPQGVDWRDESSQLLRFEQLLKIIISSKCELNEFGCGYGKLFEYLSKHYPDSKYRGYDLSSEMIHQAKTLYPQADFFHLSTTEQKIQQAEYSVASGIFNVKMDYSDQEWLNYILETLDILNQYSKFGFSFNILTKYSDQERMQANLYYADPAFLFDYCKRNFSKNVALLHDYDLYEFTLLIRK